MKHKTSPKKKAKSARNLSASPKDLLAPDAGEERELIMAEDLDTSREDEGRHGRGSEYYDDANTDEDEYADNGQGEFREASERNY